MKIEKFQKQINGTRFQTEVIEEFSFNGSPMSRGYYNLVVSIRDVSLFCMGMKPTASWRLGHVKNYFGIKGGKEKVLAQLQEYKAILQGEVEA